MKTSMLEYCKTVLVKVSFNRQLSLKEYRKAKRWLQPDEATALKEWIRRDTNYSRKSGAYLSRAPVVSNR